MRKIETEGNSPEEWKAYIDFLKTVPSEGDVRVRPLSEAYSRAFTVSAPPPCPFTSSVIYLCVLDVHLKL